MSVWEVRVGVLVCAVVRGCREDAALGYEQKAPLCPYCCGMIVCSHKSCMFLHLLPLLLYVVQSPVLESAGCLPNKSDVR